MSEYELDETPRQKSTITEDGSYIFKVVKKAMDVF